MLFVLAQTHELGPFCMVPGREPGHVMGVDGEQKLIELFPTEADSDMLSGFFPKRGTISPCSF